MYAWERWEQEMTYSTTPSERDNLQVHVDNCQQRYLALENRLTNLELKLDKIEEKIANLRLDFFKIVVGTGGSIIVAIIGAVAAIKHL